jgi:hypothetical protein
MVVSINPFKVIEKYGEQCINEYRTKPADQLPAHLYSVAQQAYSYVCFGHELAFSFVCLFVCLSVCLFVCLVGWLVGWLFSCFYIFFF